VVWGVFPKIKLKTQSLKAQRIKVKQTAQEDGVTQHQSSSNPVNTKVKTKHIKLD